MSRERSGTNTSLGNAHSKSETNLVRHASSHSEALQKLSDRTRKWSRKSTATASGKASLCSSRDSRKSSIHSAHFMRIFDCGSFNASKAMVQPKTLSELEYLVSRDTRLILLYFGAKWCKGCKVLLPEIEKWSAEYPEVVFCSIDVDKHTDIADEFDIQDLPTVMFFKHEKPIEFVLGADVTLTLTTIQKHRDAPGGPRELRPITSNEEFRFIVEREKGPVVILVQDRHSGELEPAMMRLSGEAPYMLVCTVDATHNKETLQKLSVKKLPSVLVFLDDHLVSKLTTPTEASVLRQFRVVQKPALRRAALTVLGDEGEFHRLLERAEKDKLIVIYFFADYCDYCKKLDEVVVKLAENYRDVLFCKMDVDYNKTLIKRLGLKKVPTVHLYRNKDLVEEVIGAKEKSLKKLMQRHR